MSDVHVGLPPTEWEGWEIRRVRFHRFESLSAERGRAATSPKFSQFDHEWRVRMYPGGKEDGTPSPSKPGDEMVAFFLDHVSGPSVSVQWGMTIRDKVGAVIASQSTSPGEYDEFSEAGKGRGWGWINLIRRADLVGNGNASAGSGGDGVLDRCGTLTVEVRMRPDDDHRCPNFIPTNDVARNVLRSFGDEDTSDVTFEVRGGDRERGTKSVLFHAHRLVLRFCARGSTLASLCEDMDDDDGIDTAEPVPVSGVDPAVFRQMLYYIYGGTIPATEWKRRSRDFIDAADRYGVRNLKIEAEAWHAKHLELTCRNVVDELRYADEKNCFLLKEKAIEYILRNGKDVLTSNTFDDIPESSGVVREVITLAAMSDGRRRRGSYEEGGDGGGGERTRRDLEDLTELSINELRARVYDRGGEDIDGPRKRLIAQLDPETNKRSPQTNKRSKAPQ